jgi:hypothetical protein
MYSERRVLTFVMQHNQYFGGTYIPSIFREEALAKQETSVKLTGSRAQKI